MRRFLAVGVATAALAGCGGGAATTAARAPAPPPALYEVRFDTTQGPFVVAVHADWAPRGAKRFHELVAAGFYDGDRLFRVIPGFVVQWGINGAPGTNADWERKTIPDDPVRHSNTRGTITFAATGAPDSRTTQVFVNLGDNSSLDAQGFAPFGEVTSGMDVFSKLYAGYGEQPTNAQGQEAAQGEPFFAQAFPKLDRIETARFVG